MRKVFLRSSYDQPPCSSGSGLLSLWESASCSSMDILGNPHREVEKRAGQRVNAMMGYDLWEETERLMGEPGDGVWLDLSEAVGTRGSHRRGDRDREGTPGEKDFLSTKQQDKFWLVSGNIFIRCLRPALSSFQLITGN